MTEKQNRYIRTTAIWTGDVWKAFAYIRMTEPYLECCVIDMDWGCGVIRRSEAPQELITKIEIADMDWDLFQSNKRYLLNVVHLTEWLDNQI